jgi:hypothetical protein
MGAWSATIMGNDSVLDEVYTMEDLCEGEITKKSIETHISQIYRAVRMSADTDFLYVVGVKLMENGVAIQDEITTKIIKACREEIEEGCDHWIEPNERIFYLNDYIDQLSRYYGQPTELKTESLFDKIIEGEINEKRE